jgi:hypothetical protein
MIVRIIDWHTNEWWIIDCHNADCQDYWPGMSVSYSSLTIIIVTVNNPPIISVTVNNSPVISVTVNNPDNQHCH